MYIEAMTLTSAERHDAELISLEALAGVNPTAILNRFPQFFSSILASCERVLAGLRPGLSGEYTQAGKELAKKLSGKSYSKLAEMNVYAPAGMKGSYLDHIAFFQPIVERASSVPGNVVAPYARWVASMLASPTRLSSLNTSQIPQVDRNFFEGAAGTALHDLIDLREQGKPEHVPYGQALARNADWSAVFEGLGKLEGSMSVTPANTFSHMVADLGHNVNRLVDLIKNDPETYKTSGAMLNSLTCATVDVANTIEYYAAAYYLLRQFETAVEDSKKKLLAALS